MNRKFNIAISSLVCIAVLLGCSLPVQAAVCTHPAYADGTGPEPTGVYDYRADAHYQQYGVPHMCLKCGWTFYTDTYYAFECFHSWARVPFQVEIEGTFTTLKYHCEINGCPRVKVSTNGVERCLDSLY